MRLLLKEEDEGNAQLVKGRAFKDQLVTVEAEKEEETEMQDQIRMIIKKL